MVQGQKKMGKMPKLCSCLDLLSLQGRAHSIIAIGGLEEHVLMGSYMTGGHC